MDLKPPDKIFLQIEGEQYGEWEGCTWCADKINDTDIEYQHQSGWISVDERLPDENEEVWFWLIPKPPEECPCDSSGNHITSKGTPPFKSIHRWRCWGSLFKPTHWMPLPEPPKETPCLDAEIKE